MQGISRCLPRTFSRAALSLRASSRALSAQPRDQQPGSTARDSAAKQNPSFLKQYVASWQRMWNAFGAVPVTGMKALQPPDRALLMPTTLVGLNLHSKKVNVSDLLRGQISMVGVCYNTAASDAYFPFREAFLTATQDVSDTNWVQMLMYDFPVLINHSAAILEGVRSETSAESYDNRLLVFRFPENDIKSFRELLSNSSSSTDPADMLLVDWEGRIRWRFRSQDEASQQDFDDLRRAITDLVTERSTGVYVARESPDEANDKKILF